MQSKFKSNKMITTLRCRCTTWII